MSVVVQYYYKRSEINGKTILKTLEGITDRYSNNLPR